MIETGPRYRNPIPRERIDPIWWMTGGLTSLLAGFTLICLFLGWPL